MSAFEKAWANYDPRDTESGEAKLIARALWNAAIDAAKAAMPDAVAPLAHKSRSDSGQSVIRAVGFNRCLSEVDERLSALRAPSSSAPGEDAG